MKKEIKTDKAPQAIGPYSQAILANGFLFCSGQIPIIPETNVLLTGSIEDQTRLVLKNVAAVLDAAGCSLDDVVKTTVYLVTMDDFKAFNAVYAGFFPVPPPARTTVAVAGLPAGARVEIEAIIALE